MSVKVSCPSCDKVLKAPDAARGKAVRCPDCQAKVPVPAEDEVPIATVPAKSGAGKKGSKAKRAASDADFLTGLDLSKSEDRSARLCYKCGASLDEEETVCPKCGLDQVTGASTKRDAGSGPNPSEFYRNVWKDSWAFSVKHKAFAFRIVTYMTIVYAALLLFFAGFFWCYNIPPKAFCGILTAIYFLTIPGVMWFVTTHVVVETLDKKKKKFVPPKFDFFGATVLGMKFVLWQIVFFIPVLLFGGGLMWILSRSGNTLVGLGVMGFLCALLWVMFPVVMAHMSMPVSIQSWFAWEMAPITFRVLGPSLYICAIFLATNLVAFGTAGAVGALYGAQSAEVISKLSERSDAQYDKAKAIRDTEDKRKGAKSPDSINIPPVPDNLNVLIFPAAAGLIVVVAFGLTTLINARALGLFTYYFKDSLALIAQAPERSYKYKETELDEDGVPVEKKKGMERGKAGQIATLVVVGVILLFLVANVAVYFATGGQRALLPGWMVRLLLRLLRR